MKIYNKHHNNAPSDAVYIGRGSTWGNPFVIGKHGSRKEVIQMYREKLEEFQKEHPTNFELMLHPLIGKDLVCFCTPLPCHGEVLVELVKKHFPECVEDKS